ncbi:MAG TPA: nuclear transport factor 2 family protein [Waterburya sp.]
MEKNKVSTEEIAALLTIYFDNMAAMNAEGWLEIFSENALIHDPVGTHPRLVHKDSQQFFKILSNFFEKIELSKDNIFFVKNGAAVKWTMRVVAKSGRHATDEGISVFEINDIGKIQKVSSYWDEAALMMKLKG